MATLSIVNGNRAGETFELARNQVAVGRDKFCDVVIPVRSVSRQHARIVREPDGYFYIEDLGSLNGTFVNGQRVTRRTKLTDRDRIRLYDVLLEFHKGAVQSDAATDETSAPRAAKPKVTIDDAPPVVRSTTIVGALDATAQPRLAVGAQAKLRAVLEIIRNLGKSLSVDEFLRNILDTMFAIFPQADRGYVLIADESTGRLVPRAVKRGNGEASDSWTLGPIDQAVAKRVMAQGQAILSTDASPLDTASSVLQQPTCSMISVPLMGPSHKPLGLIHIDTNDPARQFNEEDLEVLVSVATVAGQAVEYARTHEAAKLLERRQRDLSMAQQVQLHFLPQEAPVVPGYKFYSFYRAAEDVGGDYFGYIPLADGRLAIALGDVSGKGVSAALLMARLCSEVRFSLVTSKSPIEAVARLNSEFSGPSLGDMFVTFLLLVLDPQQHTLTLVDAGHIPPLWRHARSGVVEQLGMEEAGPPLGYDAQQEYGACVVALEPGDAIVLYTDGISEASTPGGTFYGMKRVTNLVARASRDVATMGRQIVSDVERFRQETPQSDDICLLCFARE